MIFAFRCFGSGETPAARRRQREKAGETGSGTLQALILRGLDRLNVYSDGARKAPIDGNVKKDARLPAP
ncbi:hypothetical protein CIW54_05215 [Paraburkholderia sp. T12-10]|nr:hypothetical protein CIW54_05215 [Paraburkholderia sp. T12-10]